MAFRAEGFGFMVWGLSVGFRVHGLGFVFIGCWCLEVVWGLKAMKPKPQTHRAIGALGEAAGNPRP